MINFGRSVYIRSSEEILGLVKLIEGLQTLDIFLSKGYLISQKIGDNVNYKGKQTIL